MNKGSKMIVKTNSKDALQIAKELLQELKPPIGVFVREDFFKKLENKEHIEAINSLTHQYTIEELRQKKVLFITYHRKLDILPIEANWELFMGNKNTVYVEIKDENEHDC